ncbi:alpha/beta hydrolase [Marinilabilia sp.]|uniref:alpha/beta hydrolase n=1 Tax=Marinilabilia sp. TaxID=2021252 RepID=UPI0025C4AC62|nr:alpha/beta hydrolase [Marinilabilia sp.]
MKHICILLLIVFSVNATAQNKTIPRDTTFTFHSAYNKIKNVYPVAQIVTENLPDGVVEHRDLVYATLKDTPYGDRDLHMDLFRPEGSKKLPALILIHGGGWSSGDKSMEIPLAQQIAARGYVTITVEYQLSPEALYPAAVHNIKAALRWTRAHATEYDIDPEKIAISGSSAGGQLAALIGLTPGVEKFEGNQGYNKDSTTVQAIIVVDGSMNFLAPLSLNKPRNRNSADVIWLNGFYHEKPQVWKEASPIFYAGKNAPPMLFLNSGFPRFHSGQDELIGILNQHSIYNEVHTFPVKVHPFWLFYPWFEPTVELMSNFLDRTLKK